MFKQQNQKRQLGPASNHEFVPQTGNDLWRITYYRLQYSYPCRDKPATSTTGLVGRPSGTLHVRRPRRMVSDNGLEVSKNELDESMND